MAATPVPLIQRAQLPDTKSWDEARAAELTWLTHADSPSREPPPARPSGSGDTDVSQPPAEPRAQTIQRQTMPAAPGQPSEAVQRKPAPAAPELDLDELARDVFPLIKRMLAVERERRPGP